MSHLTNTQYFAQRARCERLISRSAADRELAEAHAHMAARYEDLAREFELEPPRLRAAIR